jgi:exosortase
MIERRSWRFVDGVLVMSLVGLAVAATWPVWQDIYAIATRDEEQSHILLAPLVAAWLMWARRQRLRLTRPRWSLLGPAVIGAGWGLIALGFARAWDVFEHLGALVIVLGAALTVLGPQFFLRFGAAAGALLFLIPVPGRIRLRIAEPLQEVSAQLAQFGLELFAVPVTRAGNVLIINSQEVAVAEACNGMRMVAALALVSYAFVFSVPMRNSVRIGILLVSPIVAIVCNVLRLVPTVLLYGYSNIDVAETFHDLSGWAMLFVALGILWAILSTLRWIEVPIAPYAVVEE